MLLPLCAPFWPSLRSCLAQCNWCHSRTCDLAPSAAPPREWTCAFTAAAAYLRALMCTSAGCPVRAVQCLTERLATPLWLWRCQNRQEPSDVRVSPLGGLSPLGGGPGRPPGEWLWCGGGCDPSVLPPQRVVLYVHGGAFALCSPSTHRGITLGLLQALERGAGNAAVFAVAYRQPPAHPHPAPADDVLAAYAFLAALEPRPAIVLAGDSSGGALVVEALLRVRDGGVLPAPAGAICLSPWCDLEEEAAGSWEENKGVDYVPAAGVRRYAEAYAGGKALRDVSIAGADLRGLPKLLVVAGEKEVLLGQISRFVASARTAGVTVEFRVESGMCHVWYAFSMLATAEQEKEWYGRLGAFAAARFSEWEEADETGAMQKLV